MENVDNTINTDVTDKSVDVQWQIDSEWINLSSSPSSALSVSKKKGKKTKNGLTNFEVDRPPNFHFIPAVKGGKFLVVDNKALRLSQKKATGHSYWVCSIPCCPAMCVLDPEEKNIVRLCREHNHVAEVSRLEYKKFINALKIAVKENPHVKPKDLYDMQLDQTRSWWRENNIKNGSNEEEPCLPSFDTLRTAMYNSRNAVLSAVSLKATDDERVAVTEAASVPNVGINRPTRSREAKSNPKRKSAPALQDDLEEEWTNELHRQADLSDFEAWLDDDDINANVSAMVIASAKDEMTPQRYRKTPVKYEKVELKSGFSESEENGQWDSNTSLDTPRRKYRKRPASSSVFTCPHCPYKSNRHFNVQRHERLAHSTKKPEFSCKECGTSYSLEYRLKLHIKAVHQGEGHHCHVCARTFETMTGLKSHIVTKHKNEESKVHREPPPELTCKLCGRVFSTKSHLQKHTSTHVMIQPYRCCICNMAFMDEGVWLSHQNGCNDAFTIQCCLCSAFVSTAHELMAHMDIVHGRAEYSCHCGKMFPWKKSLLTHQQKCSLFLAERSV